MGLNNSMTKAWGGVAQGDGRLGGSPSCYVRGNTDAKFFREVVEMGDDLVGSHCEVG